ncbi:TetR/AcrR family transcriptional regulator C-terminal domain-containing protein [Pseudorhodoplanes sinuspersici]|uniref:TetR/AcrR family transcriptional regulator C-terminal domain-containing protein n=1 Tax=Pseudorhodoplanes sinuspersici TaxID=1235591 RepID=UPI0012FE18A1|nr:TetR/AcrR family transcriptional regulator C-terminal domain-containing protein [Pseudorhodoplanes sinuspersici]
MALIVLRNRISAGNRSEAALRAQRQLFERDEFRGIADLLLHRLRHRHELPEELRRPIVNLSREYQSLVQRIFEEGVAKGEFRGGLNPQLAMLALLGLCNSVIAVRSLPKTVKIDAIIDEYFQIFVSGFRGSAMVRSNTRPRKRTHRSCSTKAF